MSWKITFEQEWPTRDDVTRTYWEMSERTIEDDQELDDPCNDSFYNAVLNMLSIIDGDRGRHCMGKLLDNFDSGWGLAEESIEFYHILREARFEEISKRRSETESTASAIED